jgi:hypothetical protein
MRIGEAHASACEAVALTIASARARGPHGAPRVELPAVSDAADSASVRFALEGLERSVQPFSDALADPETTLMALANLLERADARTHRAQIDGQRVEREATVHKQLDAIRRASESASSAAFWGTLAKIASYVGAAAGVIASIASCVVTGPVGIAGAAAIVGVVASAGGLLAQGVGDVATLVGGGSAAGTAAQGGMAVGVSVLGLVAATLGAIANPLNALSLAGSIASLSGQAGNATCAALSLAGVRVEPAWLPLVFGGVSLAGGAIQGGASLSGGTRGVASGAAAGARAARVGVEGASRGVRTLGGIAAVSRGAARVVEGASVGVGATLSLDAERARGAARSAGEALRRGSEAVERLVEELRELVASYQRQRGRALEMSRARAASRGTLAGAVRG